MKFVRVHELSDGLEPLRDRLLNDLRDGLEVLWLATGGSSMPLSVAVMAQLPDQLTERLTIMLTDERYGEVGHSDSNAHQMDELGFLPKQATVLPVLREGLSLVETCQQYAADFQSQAKSADSIIGMFGMGADGHIAGCLPGTPAVSSADLAAGYTTETFTRVTLTPKAIQQVNVAYLFAFGEAKRSALERLRSESLSLDVQPVQILKQLPEAYIYNDQIGD